MYFDTILIHTFINKSGQKVVYNNTVPSLTPVPVATQINCKLNHRAHSHDHPGVQEDVYGLFPTTQSQLPFIDPDSQSPA